MEFYDVLHNRYSCRKYKPEPPSGELIEKLIRTAGRAPSAANTQPWKFIVVTDGEIRRRLSEGYKPEWFWQAPVIVVACVLPDLGWVRKHDAQNYAWGDVCIAFDHLTLAATREGLATCWIGAFREEPIKGILGIPEEARVVAMTPLGYPDDVNPRTSRKNLSEILCWGRWGLDTK